MRKTLTCAVAIAPLTLALAACSKPADIPAETTSAAAASAPGEKHGPGLDKLPVTLPQLAYEYDYRWRLSAGAIGPLQRAHAQLCEAQGPAGCRILGMSKSGESGGAAGGELQLAVAAAKARAFGDRLEEAARKAGAEAVSADIASEELSKDIVDTEARLRARTLLRDRLTEVLRTRKGTVAELVEAERSVAAVNEEIDQARSWLAQIQGRVAYSRVTLRYETGGAAWRDFLAPVSGAIGSLGTILGALAALLIVAGAVVLPAAGLWWALRALRRRLAPVQPPA